MRRPMIASVTVLLLLSIFTSPLASAAVKATPSPASTSKNPYGGGSLDPAGPNDPLLTVTNGKKIQNYTMKNLLAMHPTVISIFEPFVKKRQKFSVIPLTTFFKKAGIPGSARVATKALNDYIYTNTASGFRTAKGYLAIKLNGSGIPYDQGGPIRIVYPDGSSWATLADPWNWSLRSIYVTK